MSDIVSGKAAVDLAFIAYENGMRAAQSEPQRLRVQAAPGAAVDIVVHGAVTAKVLRNTANLLVANAEILDDGEPLTNEVSQETHAAQVVGDKSRDDHND